HRGRGRAAGSPQPGGFVQRAGWQLRLPALAGGCRQQPSHHRRGMGAARDQAESDVHHCASGRTAPVSLLRTGNETVTVYPETTVIDSDGNTFTRPAKVGTLVHAVVQPITSTENADGGFNTESRYRLRL